MTDQQEEIKKLYRDTAYFHLLYTGYPNKQAKMELERIIEVDNK